MDALAVSARVPGNGQVEIFYTSPTKVKGKFNIGSFGSNRKS